MKKWLVTIVVFIIFLIGMIISYFLFLENKTSQNEVQNTDKIAEENKINNTNNVDVVLTSYSGFKVTPSTVIVFETKHKECNHTEIKEEKANEDIINMNEEELQKKYKDWTIKQFSIKKIVLYNEKEGYCDEHYILKEKDGFIGVFRTNGESKEELVNLTSIAVQYLPETDRLNIENGLKIYGKDNLNKTLEDFE